MHRGYQAPEARQALDPAAPPPTPLLCSVCEQPIRVGQRCYTISICRAGVSTGNQIGPFGGWGSEPEPTFCATCMGDAATTLECLHMGWKERSYCGEGDCE
jgi:hypothetical protein